MKSLKECLLNEMRINIKNAKVVKVVKKFGDLKPGDPFYTCEIYKKDSKYDIKSCTLKRVEAERSSGQETHAYFIGNSLVEEKFDYKECIILHFTEDSDPAKATYSFTVPKSLPFVLDYSENYIYIFSTSKEAIEEGIEKLALFKNN